MACAGTNRLMKPVRSARADRTPARYRPLSPIWEGTVAARLERMLEFYPREHPQRILDATVNVGRFWSGRDREVVGLDINVKICKGPIVDPKWKTAHHARRQQRYWLVFRRSVKCE